MLETNKYDFGTVEFGKKYTKEFVITNNSGKTATITNVYQGGCNCVNAAVSKKVLEPKETTKLIVVIEPGSLGLFRRSPGIAYTTEDFGPINESLEVTAYVK